jgi:hypothetical protein
MNRLYPALCGVIVVVAACAPRTDVVTVPTIAQLPTLTASVEPTDEPTNSATASPVPPSPTVEPSATTRAATIAPASATSAPTLAAITSTAVPTHTASPEITVTPSLTITDTNTPVPSFTFTATLDLGPLGSLALLAANATVLPIEQRYPAPTLTALAIAAEQLRQATYAQFALPTALSPGAGTAAPGSVVVLGTLPAASAPCPASPPGGLGIMLASDAAFAASLGCPVGGTSTLVAARQPFERGAMLYVQGSPGTIYALDIGSRFRRFDDTWVEGVDPASTGLTPPPGLLEPARGFGKVWRDHPDLQVQLGWATAPEAGQTATVQRFERGLALYLPADNQTWILADDVPFTGAGAWRVFSGGF